MKKKLRLVSAAVLLLVIGIVCIGAYITIHSINSIDHTVYDNEIRLEISDTFISLREGKYEAAPYPYVVADRDGLVCYSTSREYQAGSTVSINELISNNKSSGVQDKEYKIVMVVSEGTESSRFAVFLIPREKVEPADAGIKEYLPCILAVVISLIIAALYCRYMNRNVFRPINEISASAKAIIAGNYDLEVVRVYGRAVNSSEMEELIYSFELMRDELKEKQLREEALQLQHKELISCISHDLRTPLSTIKAYGEGLRDGIARTKEDKAYYVSVILEKTGLLVGMIKELLEYSNASANQLKIEKKECYLQSFLPEVVQELQVFIEKNEITFVKDVMEEDLLLKLDRKRIEEVLFNLAENSIKYKASKKPIIKLKVSRKEDNVLFQVIDNGAGISSEDILYVFDKFYRTEKSRTSSVPGSGLGLSICQYIVNGHNGEIYCKSRQGEGCEIGFTLPI